MTGHLASLITAFILPTAAIATRYIGGAVDPFSLAAWRFAVPCALFFLYLAIRRAPLKFPAAGRGRLILAGVLFFGVFPVFFNFALERIPAARAILLLATVPLWTALLNSFTGSEHFRKRRFGLALTAAGIGALLVTSPDRIGDTLMLGCAMLASLNGILVHALGRTLDVPALTFFSMLAGQLVLWPLAFALGSPFQLTSVSVNIVGAVVYLGVIPGVFGVFLRLYAVSAIGPALTGKAHNLLPLFGAAQAAWFLGEDLPVPLLIPLALVFTGTILISMSHFEPRRRNAITHK